MKSKFDKMIRDFIYVDNNLLDKYVEQIRNAVNEVDKKSWKMSASITGPVIESSRTTERVALKTHEKIDLLQAVLETKGAVRHARPETTDDQNFVVNTPRFVLETMFATKVVLPASATNAVKGLSSVAIWISDPDPKLYSNEEYNWRGTFVYLSELHWDNGGLSHYLSGVSALQVIVNLSSGKDFFEIIEDEFEPFGRGRDLHPIDKLKDIGGIVTDKRRVKSLYRIRYLTNEQTYNYEGQKRRVNDLLGYPVYISDES